jgi:predicted cupin superfamily sugar epimerase
MTPEASYWIEKLTLQKHPEGGYFRETYRATECIPISGLPSRFTGERCLATGIYFLLTDQEFSAFHRIKADEMWHFYKGKSMEVYVIQPNGELQIIKLGHNYEKGEVMQAVVPANCWFASRVVEPDGYALVGCTVSPGFDFDDFELAQRDHLKHAYPKHESLIDSLTRT